MERKPGAEVERSISAKEFHLEEWKSLREEIAANGKETLDTERNVVIATFAVWLWVLTQRDCAYWPALLLPPVTVALGMWRCQALGDAMWDIGQYLRKIEKTYGLPALGWESHFRGERGENPRQHRVGMTRKVFWRILLATSVIISVVAGARLCWRPQC